MLDLKLNTKDEPGGAATKSLTPYCTEMLLHFHFALGFETHILAHTSDSLIRVSRRVNRNPTKPMFREVQLDV